MKQKNYYDIVVETVLESQNFGGRDFLSLNPEDFNEGLKILSPKEYEILGAISYLHGLSFISQNGEMNKEAMANFEMRATSTELSIEDLQNFGELITKIDINLLYEANLRQQKLVSEISSVSAESLQEVFSSIIIFSKFDIAISEDVHRLSSLKEISYIDLLKIHQTIFENLDIGGAYLHFVDDLLKLPNFAEELIKASFYFDLQKFALIAYDSIMSLREYFETEQQIFQTYVAVDVDTLRTQKEIDIDFVANNPQLQNVPVEPNKSVAVDVNNTDEFFRAYMMEIHPEKMLTEINNPEDIIKSLDVILKDEDALPKAFQFMRVNVSKNRSDLKTVYGFNISPVVEEFQKRKNETKKQLRISMEEYHKDIDPEILGEIVERINLTITSVIAVGAENKGYFMQQLNGNGIFTYKHLHQIISLIEECEIDGSMLISYINLVEYLREKSKISAIIEIAENMETEQMYLQYYTAVLDFFDYAK